MKPLAILILIVSVAACAGNKYEDYTPAIVVTTVEYDGQLHSLGCKGEFRCEKETLECVYHYHKEAQNHIDKVKYLIKLERENVPIITELYNALCNLYEAKAHLTALKIWQGGTTHPVFEPESNLKLRAVHDYMAHIQAIGFGGTGFDMKGEIQAYNSHLHTIPPHAASALFTEVVGQAAFFINNGYFPEQKITFLSGFDYFNVGVVEGYDIINKELVKTQSEVS